MNQPPPRHQGPNQAVHELYRRWRAEDRELEIYLDRLRDWIQAHGSPANRQPEEWMQRLNEFRQRLETHFRREDQITIELTRTFKNPPVELDAAHRQASHDHRQLLDRLDRFIERIGSGPRDSEQWRRAVEELELFVDVLEQHEDQESESIELLMPYEPPRH